MQIESTSGGTVNLLPLGRARWQAEDDAGRTSGCRSNPADIRPHLERSRPWGAKLAGGDVVAAEMEEIGNLVVGGDEALCLPGSVSV
ncbi:hypothetical protein [Belnapia moabensis]|uniref:hypothetical protein n=1 Tax=Belnapia moabensis TaxID=365533 RepID=UPI0012EE86E6|nr:hypothetical protein [Belnapia moabensis]